MSKDYLINNLEERLSPHFTLWECIRSTTAERRNIDNRPPEIYIPRLRVLCEKILEPIRNHYGIPIRPNSVYRCKKLNRRLKSKRTSKHLTAEAVDIEVPGISNYELAQWCRRNLPEYDTIILEMYTQGIKNSGWVHISRLYNGVNRRLTFTYYKDGRKVKGLWR